MKKDKKLYVASFCGLGLTVMSGVALSQVPEGALAVNSAERSVSASVTVATACTMNGVVEPGQAHTATVLPGTYTTDIGLTTLTVTCNDPGGFDVYAVGYSDGLWGGTELISYDLSGYNITTGLATSGETSNWAMKVNAVAGTYAPDIENNYNNYHIVPDDAEKVASFPSATNSVNGSKMTTTYAAYVSSAQVAGTYEGQVKYILVNPTGADKPTKPVCVGYNKMQDIASLKDTLFTTVGTQVQLCDARDEKIYYVAKLADGNIWMTQNLDLDITTAGLSTTDTDIVADWNSGSERPPVATLTDASQYSNSNNTTSVASWDAGDWYYDGTSSTSCGSGKTTYEGCTGFSSTGDAHRHVGNMYSWGAATAGTGGAITSGQAEGSICPKGWRLPTGGNSGEFVALQTAGSLGSTVSKWTGEPYYFVRGGVLWYDSDKLNNAGRSGYYWSSTPYSASDYAYLLYFVDSSDVYPANYYNRAVGLSVRCVAR